MTKKAGPGWKLLCAWLAVAAGHGLAFEWLSSETVTAASTRWPSPGTHRLSSEEQRPQARAWVVRNVVLTESVTTTSIAQIDNTDVQREQVGPGRQRPYLPRTLLTTGPQPLDPIVIDYPPQLEAAGNHTGELALYIDEHGVVTRVETLTQDLPPPMAIAARLAFQQARFRPGERDGVPVRARIVVEVRFDASASGDAAAPPLPDEPAAALAPPLGLPRS
ncbi:hypothetical protein GTZ97_10575 [Aquabacterium fontiphilum]|jgi:hypothetical protein|uniref:energy transducer TonB n=1 Tax=Aquabacterium fontiphilum TaxID=450365 RepID=UPI001377BEC2|nr:energy transducer TonB [Aquabacterium fontiphilum]NBD21107.1 hypothetical protein [Aquabacterium fontiphilum]